MQYHDDLPSRQAVLQTYQDMIKLGLGIGTSGNISVRVENGMLITPSGIPPALLAPSQIVFCDMNGVPAASDTDNSGANTASLHLKPSSEWQMHASLYKSSAATQAVVHCHSRHATILACAHKAIPPLHYMIAVAKARDIPCAPYQTFGTTALADAMLNTIGERNACLLANHGQIARGNDLAEALRVASEVEELAATYWGCLAIGSAELLNGGQLAEVEAAFQHYGPASSEPPGN